MKKGIILLVAAIAVIAIIFLIDASSSSSNKEPAKPAAVVNTMQESPASAAAAAATTTNELPQLPFTQLDGAKVEANNLKGKTVLVMFQPDCDHCQREARQIQQNLDAFDDYAVYFVSDADLPQLETFAKEYNLAGEPNVHFAQASINDILRSLGPIEAPSLFVYSEEGRLVKSFIGETPIEEILKVL
jgi:thiol-disulfide isomerase/thioredoxin